MKKYLAVLILAVLAASPALAQDGDVHAWLDASVEGNLNEAWRVKVNQQYKWNEDATELFEYHTDVGFSRKLADWFIMGLNYRKQYSNKRGEWFAEDRFHVNGTVKWKWGAIPFSDRSRVEYRSREASDDIFRFRNKLTITSPSTFTSLQLRPYLAEEAFLDSDHGEINQNRVYAGVKTKLAENVKAELYYAWVAARGHEWIHLHVAGFKLGLAF